MENASQEYSYDKLKTLIEHQKTQCNWEFIFLGANIDAVGEAECFGIGRSRAQNFHNESKGVELNYCVVSEAVASFRAAPLGVTFKEDWNAEIEADFKKRGEKR